MSRPTSACSNSTVETEQCMKNLFKVIKKTPERRYWRRYSVFIVTFEQISLLLIPSNSHCVARRSQNGEYGYQIKSEACSEPFQTSNMGLFVKRINVWKPLIIFQKKCNLRCLTGFWIRSGSTIPLLVLRSDKIIVPTNKRYNVLFRIQILYRLRKCRKYR